MFKHSSLAALVWGAMQVAQALAHDLPVSELRLVADQQRLHLEITLNAWELKFFSELDANNNGELEREELAAREQEITRKVLECLQITVAGERLSPYVAGIVPQYNTHHLSFRAHYRADVTRGDLEVASSLAAITRAGHVVEVSLNHAETVQRARLVSSAAVARFVLGTPGSSPPDTKPALTAESIDAVRGVSPDRTVPALALALMLLSTMLFTFKKC